MIILILIFLYSISCTEINEKAIPETPSNSLNNFIRSVPLQYINLDEASIQEIALTNDDIIYSVFQEINEEEPSLGHLYDIVYMGDQFYVYDVILNGIFRVSLQGTVEGPLTRDGRGPGEHGYISSLNANNQYIFAVDVNNARINRYAPGMLPIEPLNEFIQSPTSNTIALNDEIILSGNSKSGNFVPENPDLGLISISSINDLTDTLATIMPRIIPTGYQPFVYNSTRFSINSKHQIAASYLPLPWLFIFDKNFEHRLTLILEYSLFDELNTPPLEIFRPQGSEGVGGMMPLNNYHLMDNGDLFVTIPAEITKDKSSGVEIDDPFSARITKYHLIHLVDSTEDQYRIAGNYIFYYPENEGPIHIQNIFPAESENEYYIQNQDYIFRFSIPM